MFDSWVDAKDNLPRANKKYLCWWKGAMVIAWYNTEQKQFLIYEGVEDGYKCLVPGEEITYWMDLPKAPEKRK